MARERRRILYEYVIAHKGYKTIADYNRALNSFAQNNYTGIYFNDASTRHVLRPEYNHSSTHWLVIGQFIGLDSMLLAEIYEAPEVRGIGKDWVGEITGRKVKDYDVTTALRSQYLTT